MICREKEEQARDKSYSKVGVQPVDGAVLILNPLIEAGAWGANVLIGPLPSEDPLIQTAGGQNVFLIETTE